MVGLQDLTATSNASTIMAMMDAVNITLHAMFREVFVN
jgi:hypothetical protein